MTEEGTWETWHDDKGTPKGIAKCQQLTSGHSAFWHRLLTADGTLASEIVDTPLYRTQRLGELKKICTLRLAVCPVAS